MYIAMNETRTGGGGVMSVIPMSLRRYLCNIDLSGAEELRLITGKPFAVRYPDGVYYLSRNYVLSSDPVNAVKVSEKHMAELIEKITRSSLYSVKDEIKQGYVTISGGHRAGLAGTAVTERGEVDFIKDISAVNIRLANEVIGAADKIIGRITDGGIKNTLIVSPPCAGKTTMLRDITRSLSYMGHSVAVADERCEIAAMHDGRSSFDLGGLTAVLDNCPKSAAMLMLLRSMSPEVIVTDEIGTVADAEAIRSIINSGVAVIASIHGRDTKQLMRRRHIKELLPMFDIIVGLSRRHGAGTVEEVTENV